MDKIRQQYDDDHDDNDDVNWFTLRSTSWRSLPIQCIVTTTTAVCEAFVRRSDHTGSMEPFPFNEASALLWIRREIITENFTPYYQKLPENEWRLSSCILDIAAPTNDSSCVCLSLTVMCLCLCLCVCLCVCVCEISDDGDSASGDKATTVWPNVEKSTTEKITAMQAGDEETFNNHHMMGSIIAKFVSCHERS